ncbi:hypothetical protein EIP86_007545 [Pleurotus ostreatoroseus]|nr:hypothetical protein EIP86_007545 [Pleurotus ostreatoroseus]
MAKSGECIRIPDFHALTPWRTSFNPHFTEVAAASSAWALSFDIFSGPTSQKKLEIFQKSGGALLAAYVHPTTGVDGLRTACDFINLLYAIDELTDCQDSVETGRTAQTVIRSVQDEAYDDETPLSRMTKSFMKRLEPFVGTDGHARFIEHVASYMRAVVTEVAHREKGIVLEVAEYDPLRRENSAVPCCLVLIGCVLGPRMDLPDIVFEDPAFQRMHIAAVDMISWSNDVYSYKRESEMGHVTNNVLTVLRRNSTMYLQQAVDQAGVHYRELYEAFEAARAQLPSYGAELDIIVA